MNKEHLRTSVHSPESVTIIIDSGCAQQILDTKQSVGEIIDTFTEHVDAAGNLSFIKSGEIEKKEAHVAWAPHLAAHIWIYNSRWEVLLQRRSLKKDSYPGLWDISVAWHIGRWEDLVTGGIREIEEEMGMSVTPADLKMIGIYREDVAMQMHGKPWHNNELNWVFVLQYEGAIDSLKMQEEEVEEIQFVSVEELEKSWNDEEASKLYVPKSQEYREMVISGIREALKSTWIHRE